MASESFSIRVLTPAGLLFEDRTEEVQLPGINGEIGVLSKHATYVGVLGTGILEFRSAETNTVRRCVISGGFCNVEGDILVILADSVDLPENVNMAKVGAERLEVENQLTAMNAYDSEWGFVDSRLKRLKAIEELTQH